MSDCLYPYAVPGAKLAAVSGSRDRKLLTWIRRHYSLVEWVDEMIRESNQRAEEDGEEERIEVTFLEAVRRVVYGEPLVGADDSFVYGFAYDAICQCLGRELPCDFLPFDFEPLDGTLAKLGIPLRVSALCYSSPIFPLPWCSEVLSLGHWTDEEMAKAKAPLQRASLRDLDNVVASCVNQVLEWYPMLEDGDWVIGVLY